MDLFLYDNGLRHERVKRDMKTSNSFLMLLLLLSLKTFLSFYNLMSRRMFKGHCKDTKTLVSESLYAVTV